MADSISTAKTLNSTQSMAAIGVLFASVCFGIVPYFSRNLTDQGLAPHAVAFYRYIIAAVLLFPAFLSQLKAWRELVWGLCAGAAMGLGWIGYVTAVETIPASTVGVLYMTYPVFTVIIAWALFADTPSHRALIAASLIILAAVIAGNPSTVPPSQLATLAIALAAPLGFGFGIAVFRQYAPAMNDGTSVNLALGSVIGEVRMCKIGRFATGKPRHNLPKSLDWGSKQLQDAEEGIPLGECRFTVVRPSARVESPHKRIDMRPIFIGLLAVVVSISAAHAEDCSEVNLLQVSVRNRDLRPAEVISGTHEYCDCMYPAVESTYRRLRLNAETASAPITGSDMATYMMMGGILVCARFNG
jgi:uncharacterized membrane protein